MTEKRFTVDVAYNELVMIKYNGYETDLIFSYNDKDTVDEVVDVLNHLHEENMQLKGEVAHYKLILMGLEEQARGISKIYSAPVGHCRCTTEPHRCDEND